jgi:hypothetical protein
MNGAKNQKAPAVRAGALVGKTWRVYFVAGYCRFSSVTIDCERSFTPEAAASACHF